MDISTIFLVSVALLPALVLCVFVFIKDRAEKEPIGLLLLLFGLGVVSCFPVIICELIASGILDAVFEPFMTYNSATDTYTMSRINYVLYNAFDNFLCVALIEEGFKWLIMFLVTFRNKNFNSLFDGVIYAVFVSLGFAALENIFYVVDNGWQVGLLRAVTAVPGHMFDGVIMGYFYTTWNVWRRARETENKYVADGLLNVKKLEKKGNKELLFSILVPVLAHGFYDFCLSVSYVFFNLIFFAFLIGLYIYCFIKINKLSKLDRNDRDLGAALALQAHPYLLVKLQASMAAAQSDSDSSSEVNVL